MISCSRPASAGRAKSFRANGQINPSKTKSDQINPSNIAWFYLVLFVRIGAFQWVTANPNKKILPVSHCISNVTSAFFSFAARHARLNRDLELVHRNHYSTCSVFRKENARKFLTPCRAGSPLRRRDAIPAAQRPMTNRHENKLAAAVGEPPQPYGVRRIGEGAFFGGQHGESVEDR